jgi:hypothetical protein
LFNDPVECYQAIANELVQIINEPWERIDVEAKLTGESSINTKVTYIKKSGGKGNTFDVIMLPRYFFELASLLSDMDKGLYKQCDFVLKSDGNFDVNFTY